jgi:hypothetical protein
MQLRTDLAWGPALRVHVGCPLNVHCVTVTVTRLHASRRILVSFVRETLRDNVLSSSRRGQLKAMQKATK